MPPIPPEMKDLLEYSEDGIKVTCLVCRDEGGVKVGRPIAIKSLAAHFKSPTHVSCLELYTKKAAGRAQERQAAAEAYDAQMVVDHPQYGAPELPSVPEMIPAPAFEMGGDMEAAHSQLSAELVDTFRAAAGVTPAEARACIQAEFERLVWLAEEHDVLGDDEDSDDVPPPLAADVEDDEMAQDFNVLPSSEYTPYPNKTMLLLDTIDNLNRCRFTSSQMSIILHVLKSLGAANVPTLAALRTFQKKLQSAVGSEPEKVVSAAGNIFYMNDIRESIARDFANPAVAPHLQLFPESKEADISEPWQCDRWMEYDASQLTPMFSRGHQRFWINELMQLVDGRFAIALSFFTADGELMVGGVKVVRGVDGVYSRTDEEIFWQKGECGRDYEQLVAEDGPVAWTEGSDVPAMPNAQRALVDDDEDLVVVVSPWADDVSGNKSKQYNKHMNMYAQNGCLPGRLLQQEFHMHYISSSPHATSAEQFARLGATA